MIYNFAGFELNDESFELRCAGERVPVGAKTLSVLLYLLRHAGRVVSKEELFAELWPRRARPTHGALAVQIRILRKILREDPFQSIIQTHRGQGYSLSCPVGRSSGPDSAFAHGAEFNVVERAALLDQMRLHYRHAGRCRAGVVLHGERGVGKTWLLAEFSGWMARQGVVVLRVHGRQEEGAPPYWTLQRVLREVARTLNAHLYHREGGQSILRVMSRLRKQLHLQLAGNGARSDGEFAQFRIAQTICRGVNWIGEKVPLAIVLDDLHMADRWSLAAFGRVVRMLEDLQAFVVIAHSVHPQGAMTPPLASLMNALAVQPRLRVIAVPGLSERAVHGLAEQAVGSPPTPEFVRELHQRTQGNPFFVRELLREAASRATSSAVEGIRDARRIPVPMTVRTALEDRLHTLPMRCIELLTSAAMIGEEFSLILLGSVLGGERHVMLEVLDEAVQAQLVVAATSSDASSAPAPSRDTYRFQPPILRDVLYERLSITERTLRHQRIAQTLETLARRQPELIPALAYHHFEAGPATDLEHASESCLRAAHQALSRAQFPDALIQIERALGLESMRIPRDAVRICCLELALGRVLQRAGIRARAEEVLSRATEAARALERSDVMAVSALLLEMAFEGEGGGPTGPAEGRAPPGAGCAH